ncbi:hypothetical protein P691DRAFT_787503, partial [Macrolepiota fuliginosa MF-IS2]
MPPAFQRFLDDLSLAPMVQQVMTTYDWLLKLSLEISLVWQSRWSLVKCLYLMTRYLAIGDVTIALYGRLAFDLSAKQTWAIWGKDRKIGVALSVFYGGLAVFMFVNIKFYLESVS